MNWDLLITACIAAVPATIAAGAAWQQSKKTEKAVDGRMEELLELARKEAAAVATLAEKEAEHLRKGEAAAALVEATTKGV